MIQYDIQRRIIYAILKNVGKFIFLRHHFLHKHPNKIIFCGHIKVELFLQKHCKMQQISFINAFLKFLSIILQNRFQTQIIHFLIIILNNKNSRENNNYQFPLKILYNQSISNFTLCMIFTGILDKLQNYLLFFFFFQFYVDKQNRTLLSKYMNKTYYNWLNLVIQRPQVYNKKEVNRHTVNVTKDHSKLNKMHDNISKLINNQNVGLNKRTSISNFQINNQRQNANKKILKKAFSKMDYKKKLEDDKTEEENIEKLKQHINDSMKVHNKIIQNNQFILNSSKNQERKKFLKNQISFTEIDQQKIIAQRKILQQNHFLNRSIGQLTSIYKNTTRLSINNETLQINASQQLLLQCFKTIDTSFDIIEQLSKIGYNKRKNKYVLDYCQNYKGWLKDIYLQESKDNQENYTLNIKYLIVQNASIAKQKLASYLFKAKDIDMNQILQDLQGLFEHIEHLLAQKKILQIGNVGQFIERKIKNGKQYTKDVALKFNKVREEHLNLTLDLAQIEARFGQMKAITKVSRKNFEQLNKSYQKLISLS